MQDRVPAAGPRLPTFWLIFAVLLITLAVYLPAFQNGFVNLDDYTYITSIAPLSWTNVKRIFAGYFEGYHPLSMLSLGLTYHFCEFNPWPYHFTNVMLHLANTALIFFFVSRLLSPRTESGAERESVQLQAVGSRPRTVGLVTALLFGIHPVHVEAVAWVTSRKDVLYSLFYLLSLLLYLRYLRSRRVRDYAAALLLGLLSVLSKGMAASLPLSLLAIDFLLGRRLRAPRTILEKIPFLAMSGLFGIISVLAQQSSGYMPPSEHLGMSATRTGLACRAFVLYLRNLALPHKVTAFHPYPAADAGSPGYVLAVALLAAALIYCSRKLRPVAFGGLFFAANIVLVLQLLPVANFIIADRYNYLSSAGIFFVVALAFGWSQPRRAPLRWGGRAVLAALGVLLAILSFSQCTTWKSSTTVWTDVLAHYPDSAFALNMRGCAGSAAGNYAAAIADFDRAAAISPSYARSYINRGYARHRSGDLQGAEADYTRAVELRPRNALAHNNRGLVRQALGNCQGALADYTAAIELGRDPRMLLLFRSNRAIAHLRLGDARAALADADHVLLQNPDHYRARLTRARARFALGDIKGAFEDADHAAALAPGDEEPRALKEKIDRESVPPSAINHPYSLIPHLMVRCHRPSLRCRFVSVNGIE